MAEREQKPDRLASTAVWPEGGGASKYHGELLESTAADSPAPCLDAVGRDGSPNQPLSTPTETVLAANRSHSEGELDRQEPIASDLELPSVLEDESLPAAIGRYRILGLLGRGGFGKVLLGHDVELDRRVAIKIPLRERVIAPDDVSGFLEEARLVASLDHKGIVPVYDAGRTPDGLCFVVSKFIEGCSLAQRMRDRPFSFTESARLISDVADAVHYAHKRGLVHRDIKPANVLLDALNQPLLTDFGLALKEQDFGTGCRLMGTPSYMSPEMARGEGHLVDGRSDVFSLGVVLYELLTRRKPFVATSLAELLDRIATAESRPPRQIDDAIPKDLERICLKAMANRVAERYTTARDLADDLRYVIDAAGAASAKGLIEALATTPQSPAQYRTPGGNAAGPLERSSIVVPKGLRAFDEHDADFFLELLPGPPDRDGLPESLRFWKTRIEERDPAQTFRVGLIYGPSGCGKSSLVRAGLLPRLARHVQTLYVEASPADIEHRMLRALQWRCPELPTDLDLPRAVAALRRGRIIPPGHKIVIVLDQFEQWLHAGNDSEDAPLVQALRQCDGEHVQALVLVRDDFWLAASRFLKNLDVRLLEGCNAALVDLFDPRHARRVLAMLGRAFGALSSSHGVTRDEGAFLEQAIAGLARDGKIVPVRLALFAEMLKGKPWTMATLRAIGGTEGVGVTFLDETFSAPTAPAEHRRHQEAARAVLKSLIPTTGADIKGQVRTRKELLDASGYAERPVDFDDLIRILDSELRLITPTDSSDQTDVGRPGAQANGSCYLLAHDYLVHSLREWLSRKQRESRAGRAELCLAERAALWTGRSENRLLPSLGEWLQIRSATWSKNWTLAERAMMAAADRFHAVRIATSAFVVFALVILLFSAAAGASAWRRRTEVSALVAQLFVAEWSRLPSVLQSLDAERTLWSDDVERIFADRSRPPGERQRARLLLARHSEARACELTDDISSANPAQLTVIIGRLVPWKTRVLPLLWSRLTATDVAPDARVRLAAAAAGLDPSNPQWNSVAPAVSLALLEEADPLFLSAWVEFLRPVEVSIVEPLAAACLNTQIGIEQRQVAVSTLAELGNNRPDLLEKVLLEGDSSRQFVVLSRKLAASSPSFAALTRAVLSHGSAASGTNSDWPRRVNAALALALLGDWSAVWPCLGDNADMSLRTRLIHRMRDYGISAVGLAAGLTPAQPPSVRQAILLALCDYRPESIASTERSAILDYCQRMFVTDPDAGVHAGCELLIRAWGHGADLPALQNRMPVGTPMGNWYKTSKGHLMVVFAQPGRFTMGSPATESRRDLVESAHTRLIDRSFAIGAHEVTVAQFACFRPKFDHAVGNLSDPDCPANKISLFDAFAYCRWLTEAEGMTEDQQCYPAEIGLSMKLPENFLARTGYRLPTEAEWEFGARAGSTTSCFFGQDATLLTNYAWFIVNSDDYIWPVGRLLPNRYGMFDVYGNVMEWCQSQFGPYPSVNEGHVIRDDEFRIDFTKWPVLRGGSYRSTVRENRSAKRVYEPAIERFSFVGMRLARTMPAHILAPDARKGAP